MLDHRLTSYIVITVCMASMLVAACRRQQTLMAPPSALPAVVDPWKEAALKVEQDRGEPVGRTARVDVPDEVKHYSDRRRFLAIQIAESRKHRMRTPHDFAELIEQIQSRELVEVPQIGKGYILYGVGLSATEDPFSHYDPATGDSVPLFGNDTELKEAYEGLDRSLDELIETIKRLRMELRNAPRRDRDLRRSLQSELDENERSVARINKQKKLLDSYYQTRAKKRMLESEYQLISAKAGQFTDATYNLQAGASRKAFKARLLSYLRPSALKVLESVAQSYEARFGRPLAVTSLVRTEQYQRQLTSSNPNATLVRTPPHTTGLAFDILYMYMSAAEQTFLMSELGRLRQEARIEVLRENRDHFHVFAFMEGARPAERLIKASLGLVGPEPRRVRPKSAARKRSPTRRARARRR
jgi:hypothetical protein